MEEKEIKLTEKELEFCDLFVDGDKMFAGQAKACYVEVYGERKYPEIAARRLLSKSNIAAHIKEMTERRYNDNETLAVKLQVTETLKAVMSETSQGEYVDKYGVTQSPASLRAVSVNAAKALMDIYPIKHSQGGDGKGDSKNGGNVIFNVVVPQIPPNNDGEQHKE